MPRAPSSAGTTLARRCVSGGLLVHCLTSTVSANLTANAPCSASEPPRSWRKRRVEMAAVSAVADAVLVNLGHADFRPDGGRRACHRPRARPRAAMGCSTRWPRGAIPQRTDLAHRLCAASPRLIKGNASEILALAGAGVGGRGTDAAHATAPTPWHRPGRWRARPERWSPSRARWTGSPTATECADGPSRPCADGPCQRDGMRGRGR